MSEKKSFSLKGYFEGFKTILTRNALLIIAINIANQYGNNYKNGFRTLVGTKELGLASTVIGFAVSVFLIAGLICRAPAGATTDNNKDKLKTILAGSMLLKGVVWLGFLVIKSQLGYYILFALDGIVWSFIGTSLPAVLAMSVDRRAMGSSYAVMMGLTSVLTSSARPLGINTYNNYGLTRAIIYAVIFAVVPAVLAFFMDGSKLAAIGGPEKAGKKKSSGILLKILPLALVNAMPIVLFNFESNFFQIYATENNLNYTGALTLGQSINGILTVVVGVLCDLMNPAILIIVALIGQILAPLMWNMGGNMVFYGTLVYYSTRFYATALRVEAMKSVTRGEQGALSATFLLSNDVFSVAATSVIGVMIDSMGYPTTMNVIAIWDGIALVAYIILSLTFMRKLRAEVATAEE